MSLKITDHLFYGPFPIEQVRLRSNQIPVVFAIVCRSGEHWNPSFRLIDVGFSGPEGLIVADHPNCPAWLRESDGELEVYLFDTPKSGGNTEATRRQMADDIRAKIKPPHGQIPLGGG